MHEPHYNLTLITGPAVEPISTATAKAQSRVNISDDDTYIDTLIAAARLAVENKLGMRLITQTWLMRLDCFPAREILLPYPPISAVSFVKYYDQTETLQTLSSSLYEADIYSVQPRLYPAYNEIWPTTLDHPNAVQVQYVTGYADAAALVAAKPNIVLALKMLVDHWYENRSPVLAGSIVTEIPKTVDDLLNAERVSWL